VLRQSGWEVDPGAGVSALNRYYREQYERPH